MRTYTHICGASCGPLKARGIASCSSDRAALGLSVRTGSWTGPLRGGKGSKGGNLQEGGRIDTCFAASRACFTTPLNLHLIFGSYT